MSGYGRWVNIVGEPDAGNPPVRFDGGMLESWSCHAPASYPTWSWGHAHGDCVSSFSPRIVVRWTRNPSDRLTFMIGAFMESLSVVR